MARSIRKERTSAALASYRFLYVAELARGASHIDSALTTDTRNAAIAEVIAEFRAHDRTGDPGLFLTLLAEKLDRRNNPDAAAAVRNFKGYRNPSGATVGPKIEHGPKSGQRPERGNRRL